jgi:DNA polymerase-3 subunit alpha
MAKFLFEDLSGSIPAMVWPEEFARMGDLVKNDAIAFVKGTLDRRRDPAQLVISRIVPREQGPDELARGLVVRLRKGLHQAEHLERLLRAVRIHPGGLDLYLEIVGLEQVRRAIYKAGTSLRVHFDELLLADLEHAVGAGNTLLLNQRGAATPFDTSTASIPSRRIPPDPTAFSAFRSTSDDIESDESSRDDLDDL